jgi:hypothetical protein
LSLWVFYFYFYSYYLFFFLYYQTLPSSSSHPSWLPLHSPSFSCAKIHCSPPQQLVLPLLIHSLPQPSPSPLILPHSTCHQTTPPSYTLITCWPTYYTNFTQPQIPAIPNTSTL